MRTGGSDEGKVKNGRTAINYAAVEVSSLPGCGIR